jgi:hypothetical protein
VGKDVTLITRSRADNLSTENKENGHDHDDRHAEARVSLQRPERRQAVFRGGHEGAEGEGPSDGRVHSGRTAGAGGHGGFLPQGGSGAGRVAVRDRLGRGGQPAHAPARSGVEPVPRARQRLIIAGA